MQPNRTRQAPKTRILNRQNMIEVIEGFTAIYPKSWQGFSNGQLRDLLGILDRCGDYNGIGCCADRDAYE